MKKEIQELNEQIHCYNMQSAVMNGTDDALAEVTENTPSDYIKFLKKYLKENLG